MGRAAGLAIAMVLLLVSSFVGDLIHDTLYQRSKPPVATRPENAPYPLDSYPGATVQDPTVEDPGTDQWLYSWRLTTSSHMKDVVAYYKLLYPEGLKQDANSASFDFTPHGASGEDKGTIKIQDATTTPAVPTTIDMTELKTKDSKVMSATVIKALLWLALLGILALVRGGMGQAVGRFQTSLQAVRVGTRYEKLPSAPPQIVIKWLDIEKNLGHLGFQPVFDYRVSSVDFPNASRLTQLENTTLATMNHAVVNDVPYEWIEMSTYFDDGTAVTTTTSALAAGHARGGNYPLCPVPENTSCHILYDAHQSNVARHKTGVRQIVPLDLTQIFTLWNRVEAAVAEAEMSATAPTVVAPETAAAATPEPAAPAAKPVDGEDARIAFRDRIVEKIQATYPDLKVRVKDILAIVIDKPDGGIVDLDVTTVFYMYRNNPDNGESIIDRFVGQVQGRIIEYRAPGAGEP